MDVDVGVDIDIDIDKPLFSWGGPISNYLLSLMGELKFKVTHLKITKSKPK